MKPAKDFFTRITRHPYGRHVLFWIVILVALVIAKSSSETREQEILSLLGRNAINLIAPAIAAYFLNYYVIPGLFYRKKYFASFILFAISAYLICALARILNVYVAEPLFREGAFHQEPLSQILVDFESLLTVYFPVIYFIAFSMAFIKQQKAQLEMKERNSLLEKEKAETELNFLKAQIHPHFLFNTLNNLYVLTLKKSDKAPETVIKLSEILDYILYKGNNQVVALEKEIKLLENFIALEKLRYGEQLKVSFTKNVDDCKIGISPLLLLSIVENAFKHGVSNQISEPEIRIDLSLKDQYLNFKVYNTKSETTQKDDSNYRKGIGVSNIRRQLALIYSDYNFEIEEGKDYYLVHLSIRLKDRKTRCNLETHQEIS